jgi:uncharacterized protein (TIGR00369 family)
MHPLTGGHGRAYPELDPARRAAIIEQFSTNNREYFTGILGFVLVDLRTGYARMEVENRKTTSNPIGIMHGGASFGLADSAVAAALFTVYSFDYALLTIEMKINYLEAIPEGLVVAEAYVLRHSRRSAYAEVDIWAGGKLAARASTTYMIKPRTPPAAS